MNRKFIDGFAPDSDRATPPSQTGARDDQWSEGEAYDKFMGRWSRRIAERFVDWLAPQPQKSWLELGCGTGALSAAILARAMPASLLALDSSPTLLSFARTRLAHTHATVREGDVRDLEMRRRSRDYTVSGLMLNFLPADDRVSSLAEMARATQRDGTVAIYVWDYPGGGMQALNAFWTAARALDGYAAEFDEGRRFDFCTQTRLKALAESAGLHDVAVGPIETSTVFRDFADYWTPFTLGAGQAGRYCAGLEDAEREALCRRLERTLPRASDGSITLAARAWALRGRPKGAATP